MNNTQLLDWDSRVLGLSTAKILVTSLDPQELASVLQTLKALGVQFVYWLVGSQNLLSQHAAQACHGFLADEKITYCLDLMSLPSISSDPGIEVYLPLTANTELEAIAIEISQFSRFANDPKLSNEQIDALYKAWINNACKKIVAKVILIIKKTIRHYWHGRNR